MTSLPTRPDLPSRTLTVRAAGAAATLDLDAPARGLVHHDQQTSRADELLGLDLRAACLAADAWTRGNDVVGVYEPLDARQLRATAMWRPCAAAAPTAWEVVVSAQTALEQSDASLAVVCDLAADEFVWAGAVAGTIAWHAAPPADPRTVVGVLARRGGATASSVLVAGFPGDVRRIVAERAAGRARIACWLFSSMAEKGVLFRGRVLAALGPAADDTAWAAAVWQRYAATPPVLTT